MSTYLMLFQILLWLRYIKNVLNKVSLNFYIEEQQFFINNSKVIAVIMRKIKFAVCLELT